MLLLTFCAGLATSLAPPSSVLANPAARVPREVAALVIPGGPRPERANPAVIPTRSPIADAPPRLAALRADLSVGAVGVLSALTDSDFTLIDDTGKEIDLRRAEIIALVSATWVEDGARLGSVSGLDALRTSTLGLVDGCTLVGAPALAPADPPAADAAPAAAAPPEAITWTHASLPAMRIPLERIARLDFGVRPGEARPLAAAADDLRAGAGVDTLLLRNAERISGFFAGLVAGVEDGRGTPAAKMEVDGKPIVIPLTRARALALSNPRVDAAGPRIWLIDGTSLPAADLRREADGGWSLRRPFAPATVTAANPPKVAPAPETTSETIPERIALTADSVAAILFSPQSLMPLAACTRPDQPRADKDAAISRELEPLGLADIRLDGPSAPGVTWTLPPKASRFITTLMLPDDAREFADFTVVVEALDRAGVPTGTPVRENLKSEHPAAPIRLTLDPAATTLRIRLEPGPSGRVQVKVILRRPALTLSN